MHCPAMIAQLRHALLSSTTTLHPLTFSTRPANAQKGNLRHLLQKATLWYFTYLLYRMLMPTTSKSTTVIIFLWTIIGGILLTECVLTFYILGQDTIQYDDPVDTAEDIQKLGLIPIIPSNILDQLISQSNLPMLSNLAGTL